MNYLAKLSEFIPLVETHWRDTREMFDSTSALFRLSKNLKTLKPALRSLSKEDLGDLPKKAREAYQDLCAK